MKPNWIALALLALLAACGDDGSDTPPIDAAPADAPPDALPKALSQTLYLAFEGGAIMPGNDDATGNTSTLATMSATLAPYLQNDPQRATKLAAIGSQLMTILGRYNINIVTARPAMGPYDMIVFTSDAPAKIGATGTGSALIPATCNMKESVIGFSFGRGAEIPRDSLVRNTIAMFGLTGGIPLSSNPNDCMCLGVLACANLPAPCTIGGPGTTVTTGPGSCGFTGTFDEAALFLARYGLR
jgi:hypothetical protein